MFPRFPLGEESGPNLPPFPFPFLFRFPSFPSVNPLTAILENKIKRESECLSNPKQNPTILPEKKKLVSRPAKQIQVQIIDGSFEKKQINVTLRHTENVEALEKVPSEKCTFLSVITVTAGDSTSSNIVFTGSDRLEEGNQILIPPSWCSLCKFSSVDEESNVSDSGFLLKDLNYGDEIIILKKEKNNSTSPPESAPVKVEEPIKFDLESLLSRENSESKDPGEKIETKNPAGGYQCNRCGKMFSYAYYRDKHLKYTRCVDNGDRKFPCPLCTRSFEKRDRLRIHILHVHENHRPHGCGICGKSFSQSSSLNKHLRVHSGERPYLCPFCSKSFTASSILRTHIRQHSGEKPFKCAFCGKSFASHAAHDSHVRRSHSDQNTANLIKCQECDKCFDHESHLQFHKQCFHSEV